MLVRQAVLVSPSVIFGFASDLSNSTKMTTNTETAMLSSCCVFALTHWKALIIHISNIVLTSLDIVVPRIISFLCSYPMLQHSDMEGEMAQVKQWVIILGNVWYRMLWTSAPTPARGMWRIMRRWTTKQNRRIYPPQCAQAIKELLDQRYGPSWHVVVGEGFGFDISYEVKIVCWEWWNSNTNSRSLDSSICSLPAA